MKKNVFAFLALVMIFTTSNILAQKNTNIEKNKDFINVYTEDFWNKQNIAAFEKYYSADFIVHFADGDLNIEQYKGLCQAYFAAFPDIHVTTDILVAEGDKVTKVDLPDYRLNILGRHKLIEGGRYWFDKALKWKTPSKLYFKSTGSLKDGGSNPKDEPDNWYSFDVELSLRDSRARLSSVSTTK